MKNYLLFLEMEDSIRELSIPERIEVKRARKSNKFIYLYHGYQKKFEDQIKREGLLKKYSEKEFYLYPPDEDTISLSSCKYYSWFYTKRKNLDYFTSKNPLLVKVRTDRLQFTYSGKVPGIKFLLDEYFYYEDIPPTDIIFPSDPKYKEVENKCKYLRKQWV